MADAAHYNQSGAGKLPGHLGIVVTRIGGGEVQAELAAAKAAAKAAGQVWNVEPNDTPFAGVYGTPYNGPSRAQVEADLASAKIAGQVSNVEPNDMPFSGVYHGE